VRSPCRFRGTGWVRSGPGCSLRTPAGPVRWTIWWLSLTAKGLTSGEIVSHLAQTYGMTTTKETISTITDKALESMAEWRTRPLDAVCPVVFIDAVHVKIRDGHVANRPVCVAVAVTADGYREILGLWAGDGGEGAKYWQTVLTEIKNRGVRDVLMLVCDGLTACPAR
jgi:putative transposase